jgi:xanthine dehydrogenase YagS FAD-binding subunit
MAMRGFDYKNAETVQEAASWLSRYEGRAVILAGGSDLLGKLKGDILPRYPEAVINIKRIRDLDFIKADQEGLKIGAATRLHDIARHREIKEDFTALALAAEKTASPNIRQMATIGGNICQDIRCWYYRNPQNRFPCLRKGGGRCYAIEGDNRYHSIFGGSVEGGCYAVHPSDTAPALIALDASIQTTKRTIKADDFFAVGVSRTTVLEPDEIVTEIILPKKESDVKSTFMKFATRSSIDFPIVN